MDYASAFLANHPHLRLDLISANHFYFSFLVLGF